jgi:cytoskeletal protein RodZ
MTENDGTDFGQELRRNRLIRDVPLDRIAAATKISTRHLEALERGDFSRLPAPVFTKGFIRAYAVYLGLDPDQLVNAYMAATAGGRPAGAAAARPKSARPASPAFVAIAALGAALLLLIAAGDWILTHRGRTAAPAPARPEAKAVPPAHVRKVEPRAAPATAATPSAEPAEGVAPFVLEMKLDADCWVDVFADGRRTFVGLLRRGEARRFGAQQSFRLTLGNAGAVRLSVNGHEVPPLGAEGEVIRDYRMDADSMMALGAQAG